LWWGDHCNHCNHSKKHNSNHLSVHQWIRSAIRDSQQPTSPIGFLFLKFPPPPCAVLLVYLSLPLCYINIVGIHVCVCERTYIGTDFHRHAQQQLVGIAFPKSWMSCGTSAMNLSYKWSKSNLSELNQLLGNGLQLRQSLSNTSNASHMMARARSTWFKNASSH